MHPADLLEGRGFMKHLPRFKFTCQKCGRTGEVPGKTEICPICGAKLDRPAQRAHPHKEKTDS